MRVHEEVTLEDVSTSYPGADLMELFTYAIRGDLELNQEKRVELLKEFRKKLEDTGNGAFKIGVKYGAEKAKQK